MMKKITLLLFVCFFYANTYSQVTDTFFVNYANHELVYAQNAGITGFNFLGGANVNKNFPQQPNGRNMHWLMTDVNSIGYSLNDGSFFEYPNTGFQLSLDSIGFNFYHVKTDAAFDTLTIRIYDVATIARDANGIPLNPVVGTVLWETKFATDTSLLGAGEFADRTFLTLEPNLTLTPNQKYSIYMDYDGDTSNYVVPAYTYSAPCANEFAQLSQFPFNTNYFVPFVDPTPPVLNLEGVWPSGIVFQNATEGCNLLEVQNWNVFSWLRSSNSVAVNLISDQSEFISETGKQCDGDQVLLSVNTIGIDGSNDSDFIYSWSPATAVSDSTILNPIYTVGNTTEDLIFTLTDTVNNVEYKDTITIFSFAMTANAGADVTIPCATNTNVTPTASIATLGGDPTTYVWSAFDVNGTLQATISGNYTVTATNAAGCTATDDIEVTVSGENNVNFNIITADICADKEIIFSNTTSKKQGWDFEWFVDNVSVANTEILQYTFPTAAAYSVRLEADSASCNFTRAQTVNVSACTNINNLDLVNDIFISPNPSISSFNVSFELNDRSNVELSLLSIDGKVLNTQNLTGVSRVSENFNTVSLSSGIYIFKIKTDKGLVTKNIMVK